jgi:phage gp37-like protein
VTIDPISSVEIALVARIRELLGAMVRKVDSLPGDLDEELLRKMLIAAPGVYVSFGGGSVLKAGVYPPSIQSRWTLFVITGHASGQAARRIGDQVQIGAYTLTSLLAGSLDGWVVDEIGTLELADVRNLYVGAVDAKGCTLYGLTFTLPLTFSPEISPETLDDFITFRPDYDLAPTNGIIDGSDLVLPEQSKA